MSTAKDLIFEEMDRCDTSTDRCGRCDTCRCHCQCWHDDDVLDRA